MANDTKNTPGFVAYHVAESEPPFWTKIGAAWGHSDKDGLTLQLELLPMSSGQIVLRKYSPKEERAC